MSATASETLTCLHCLAPTAESDQFCCSGCRYLHGRKLNTSGSNSVETIYDHPDVRALYDFSESPTYSRYRLNLQGLHCSSCVHVLEDLPLFLDSITKARVNFSASEIFIETTHEHSLDLILKVIGDMGYPARPLRLSENTSQLRIKEDRALLLRMAVAGACAGNIMLFSVAIYGGLLGTTAFIFNGISLVLFLPVIFYSAQPFHKGAWTALRTGYITVDVPLVAALWLGFGASIFNWWRGSHHVYFDSTAGFFFFILLSRWFLRISQRKWGENFFSSFYLADGFYKVHRSSGTQRIPASQIQPGDTVCLGVNERMPVDGILLSSSAIIDTSWVTGEAVPRTFQAPMTISAGYKSLSDDVRVRASGTSETSELAQSLRRIEGHALSESRRVSIFDKAAQWLLIGVIGTSTFLLVVGPTLFGWTWENAFERALSLLVVACPCALAFGGPLAYGMALRKASENGILIKSADTLDRVLDCHRLVFDKTGTLTMGRLALIGQTPMDLPDWMKDVILALEKKSHHPVAYAFREAWPQRTTNLQLDDVREIPGKKVFGLLEGHLYSIQSYESSRSSLTVGFHQDDKVIATFDFEDVVRAETSVLLKEYEKNFELNILSGDNQKRVNNLANTLDIAFSNQLGNLSPKAKALWIQEHPRSLMLGDGLNDAEALAAAHVGVVVQGPLAQSLRFGGVYFMKPGLNSLNDLFSIAKKTHILVRRNLYFALSYNVFAGGAAVMGLVDPLVAAALMPLSSIIILYSTWRASR